MKNIYENNYISYEQAAKFSPPKLFFSKWKFEENNRLQVYFLNIMNISANLQLSMIHINGVQICPTWLNGYCPELSYLVSVSIFLSYLSLLLTHSTFSHICSLPLTIYLYISLFIYRIPSYLILSLFFSLSLSLSLSFSLSQSHTLSFSHFLIFIFSHSISISISIPNAHPPGTHGWIKVVWLDEHC